MFRGKMFLNKREVNRAVKIFLSSKIIKVILLFTLLGALITLFAAFNPSILQIKNIELKGDSISCASSEEITNESQIKGKLFFLVNAKEINTRLKKKFLCIKEVLLDVYFLSKVRMQIINRIPVAILAEISQDNGFLSKEASMSANLDFSNLKASKSYLVDDEGIIFSEEKNETNLPIIYTYLDLSLGQNLSKDRIKNIVTIVNKLREFGLIPNDAKLYPTNELIINATPKLLFNLDGDINTQLASLQLILEEAKINEDIMEFVDLRFDKPVVKYLPKKGAR